MQLHSANDGAATEEETLKNRRYDDPCGIARALDAVGERWALLVVRELSFGPKRFTDLKRGLAGASANVLSERLDELEEAGVVTKQKLPPPSAATVYDLTERGRALDEVLLALARWGSRAPMRGAGELSVDALLLALRTTYVGVSAPLELALVVDGWEHRVRASSGSVEIERAVAPATVGRIVTSAKVLRRVVFGDLSLADARADGGLVVTGDVRAAQRFLRAFRRPPSA